MSKTPITDAACMISGTQLEIVPASVARKLEEQRNELLAALEPFAHDDLCEQLGGNVQGDNSPIFGRNRSVLVLGNFRRARAAIAAVKEGAK